MARHAPDAAHEPEPQPVGPREVREARSRVLGHVRRTPTLAMAMARDELAIAWAAARLGHHATIVVPASSPREKIDGTASLGADVRVGWGLLVCGANTDPGSVATPRPA